MEYEKLYKEALERAKKLKAGFEGYNANVAIIEKIFPELSKSEDERIREAIIHMLERRTQQFYEEDGIPKSDMFAYLEKQKEQKPVSGSSEKPNYHAEWSEEDEKYLKIAINIVASDFSESSPTVSWLKSLPQRLNLPPKQEWSEADEKMLHRAITIIERNSICNQNMIDWLKSLRPQPKQEDRYMEGYQKGFSDAENVYNNGMSYHIDNPNIHKLDPNVVIHSTTDGTDVACPHWQPSEEQMKALEHCVNGWQDTADGVLESLYNDLKKL